MTEELRRKIEAGREYRTHQAIEAREGENGEMEVVGYATTFNEQYTLYKSQYYTVIEQIDSHAFDECDMSDVIMQYDHEGRVFARTRNATLTLQADLKGLAIRAALSGSTGGPGLYKDIKGGYIDRMSMGFVVAEDKWEFTEDHETGHTTEIRTITKIKKLYDVSAVSIPANDATSISARKTADGAIERYQTERSVRDKEIAEILILTEV